jgi:DNA-directed RNA polymerase specialized sigma24 family protein
MDESKPVTELLRQLRSEERPTREAAAAELVRCYTPELLRLIADHLGRSLQARLGEEDVLQKLWQSFFHRYQAGQFDLAGRDELWQLLLTMALNKTRSAARRERARRRDVGREVAAGMSGELASGLSPEEVAAVAEEVERRLLALPPDLRQIAEWKLQGFEHGEIAAKLRRTVRTVERKVQRIRRCWQALDEAAAG